jgi:hypothetical protein
VANPFFKIRLFFSFKSEGIPLHYGGPGELKLKIWLILFVGTADQEKIKLKMWLILWTTIKDF